jgi:hypothetical protein
VKNQIIINRLRQHEEFKIIPLGRKRAWMSATTDAYAYRCMPLNIANEYGWQVLSPAQFTATWNGSDGLDGIEISYESPVRFDFAQSHFGSGILTVSVDFVVQTPENISLYIRGIPNETIQDIQPLDAIVETDWLPFTFTYNYKFLKPCSIRFEKNEPLFSFFPINRGGIEEYSIASRSIEDDQDFFEKYNEYADSREDYLNQISDTEIDGGGQRYYSNAKTPNGNRYPVKNHVKKVNLSKLE